MQENRLVFELILNILLVILLLILYYYKNEISIKINIA